MRLLLVQAPNNEGYDILGNSLRLREHAFNLDGSGYGEIADNDSLDFGTGDFTLECWVKYNYTSLGSSYNCIISLGNAFASTDSASLVTDSAKFRFYIGATQVGSDVNVPSTGEWYHLVGVRDSNDLPNKMKLYIKFKFRTWWKRLISKCNKYE